MHVKMFDVAGDHGDIKTDIIETFRDTLSTGEYILGREVRALEEAFAAYIGVKYAIGVGSGNDAIKIGGLACGLKTGDRFITTPNTYIATTMALSTQGMIPVFCDIEQTTYNMDPERLEEALKKDRGIKLCIPVHLYGYPCEMDEIRAVCTEYGVPILEDACQSHGALYKEKKVGSLGDAATFSFFPTKNIGCYGDGGIIVTDSDAVYEKSIMLRAYGQEAKHVHAMEGFNSRLDEIQAAILNVKLPKLDYWNTKRRHLAWVYKRELSETPLVLPKEAPWGHHVYHLYVVRSKERRQLMKFLEENGVSTLVHYPTPIHLQGAYRHLGHSEGDFPVSEEVSREIMSLPIYPSLSQDSIMYISKCIRDFYEK